MEHWRCDQVRLPSSSPGGSMRATNLINLEQLATGLFP